MLAKDVMTTKPISAYSSDTVQAVVNLFTKHRMSLIPVVNPMHQVIGVISEISILKAYIRAKALGELEHQIADQPEILEPIVSVLETDAIQTVVQIALKASHHRVIVLDSLMHLKGLISPKDLLGALNDDLEAQSEKKQKQDEAYAKARKNRV